MKTCFSFFFSLSSVSLPLCDSRFWFVLFLAYKYHCSDIFFSRSFPSLARSITTNYDWVSFSFLLLLSCFFFLSTLIVRRNIRPFFNPRTRAEEDHYPDMCEHPSDSGCVNNCRICRFLKSIDGNEKQKKRIQK